MDLKAGSYISGSGGGATALKFYKEEEIETNDYLLERVYCGNKLSLRLLVKDANYSDVIELIPQGSVKKVYFLRMGLDLKNDLQGTGATAGDVRIRVRFNNLSVNNTIEDHTFVAWEEEDNDEYKRAEDSNHTYHASDTNMLHPSIFDKPLTIQPNATNILYDSVVQYEITLEFNFYDK